MIGDLILIGLTLTASIGSLLTFARLWQIKEWRIDRLREHCRHEGCLVQLFGKTRPAIIFSFGFLGVLGFLPHWEIVTLSLLTLLNATLLAQRKQPKPVWTMKALVLVGTSMGLTSLIATSIIRLFDYSIIHSAIVLLPIAQPLLLFTSWLLFSPVDYALKKRIKDKAKALREKHDDLIVIGITGSVGKTTTKELLAHVLSDMQPLVTPAYINAEIGVARWLIATLDSTLSESSSGPGPGPMSGTHSEPGPKPGPVIRPIIAELGAYKRGEIKTLCEFTKPTHGIITFIGSQHIALFGSQEALIEAKSELFDALPEDGHAYYNADCEQCGDLPSHTSCTITTVGTGGPADIEAFDIEETSTGISFRCDGTTFDVPIFGTHSVGNVLLTIAVARDLGMNDQDIAQKLQTFALSQHTFSVREERGITLLDDTHNASPASFKAAIGWARNRPHEQKILLTNGLIELGQKQDSIHQEMGILAKDVFDRVIVLDERNAREFSKGYGVVETTTKDMAKVDEGALVCCIGRIPPSVVKSILPTEW